jgi:ligand-binding sensor domain-containing protein
MPTSKIVVMATRFQFAVVFLMVGALWVATDGQGLFRYAAGAATRFRAKDGLPSDHVNCLAEDHEGVMWAGTTRGLARLQGGKWEGVWTNQGPPGTVWIGTRSGGLARFVTNQMDHGLRMTGIEDPAGARPREEIPG